jgi:hypothetical protein
MYHHFLITVKLVFHPSIHPQLFIKTIYTFESEGKAEMAKDIAVHPRAPGLNLGIDRNFLLCLCRIGYQFCRVLTLEHYLLIFMSIDQ